MLPSFDEGTDEETDEEDDAERGQEGTEGKKEARSIFYVRTQYTEKR